MGACDGLEPVADTGALEESAGEGDTDTDTDTDTDGALAQEMPEQPEELHRWLVERPYLEWAAWSEVLPNGGTGGNRVYLNDVLARSLADGNQQHPRGAAAVRELYDADLETLVGFAAVTRVSDDEVGGAAWLWFEVFSTDPEAEPAIAELNAPGCVGCHQQGVDLIQSTVPLP